MEYQETLFTLKIKLGKEFNDSILHMLVHNSGEILDLIQIVNLKVFGPDDLALY